MVAVVAGASCTRLRFPRDRGSRKLPPLFLVSSGQMCGCHRQTNRPPRMASRGPVELVFETGRYRMLMIVPGGAWIVRGSERA